MKRSGWERPRDSTVWCTLRSAQHSWWDAFRVQCSPRAWVGVRRHQQMAQFPWKFCWRHSPLWRRQEDRACARPSDGSRWERWAQRGGSATVRVLRAMVSGWSVCACPDQGSPSRPVRPNRRRPVPVYQFGLAGYRSEPIKFKFEFKLRRSTGSYRYTGRLDRYTGRFGW